MIIYNLINVNRILKWESLTLVGVLISFILFTQVSMFFPRTAVSFVLSSFDFVICLTPLIKEPDWHKVLVWLYTANIL